MATPTATAPAPSPQSDLETTIGQYLIDRLHDLGVEHIFGIPGDYVLTLYKMIEASPIRLVGVTREDNAGFAADAYARLHGLGVRLRDLLRRGLEPVQQHRRGLRREVAGDRAERLAGALGAGAEPAAASQGQGVRDPVRGLREDHGRLGRARRSRCTPSTRSTGCSRRRSGSSVRSTWRSPATRCWRGRSSPHRAPAGLPPSDPDALREALDEAAAMLRPRRRPMILADVEIHRFGLQDELLGLAEETGMPIATTILGKSVISEGHPLFVGVYEGAMGRDEVTECVEEADCLLMLGCFLTDINLGIFTAKLDPSRCIDATSEDLRIRHHHYSDVRLDDFIRGLAAAEADAGPDAGPARPDPLRPPVAGRARRAGDVVPGCSRG